LFRTDGVVATFGQALCRTDWPECLAGVVFPNAEACCRSAILLAAGWPHAESETAADAGSEMRTGPLAPPPKIDNDWNGNGSQDRKLRKWSGRGGLAAPARAQHAHPQGRPTERTCQNRLVKPNRPRT